MSSCFTVLAESGMTWLSHIRLGSFHAESNTWYHLKLRLDQDSFKLGWLDQNSELTSLNRLSYQKNDFFHFKSQKINNKQDPNLENLWKIRDFLQKEKLFKNQKPWPIMKRKKNISLTMIESWRCRRRGWETSYRFPPLTSMAIAASSLSSLCFWWVCNWLTAAALVSFSASPLLSLPA